MMDLDLRSGHRRLPRFILCHFGGGFLALKPEKALGKPFCWSARRSALTRSNELEPCFAGGRVSQRTKFMFPADLVEFLNLVGGEVS